ncbi:MAG: hypothetical protein R3F36_01285 [Candidatus Competibacteraceae bacterium]
MQGKLFTQDFLREGIKETDAWKCLDSNELTRFRAWIGAIFDTFPADSQANEAVTETEIVFKVLEALGWASLPQQTASGKGRQDVPDVLLFADTATKQAALAERKDEQRYRHGAAIVECKRWRRPLDRGDRTDPLDAIGNQILADFIREQVLRLSYIAVDMRPLPPTWAMGRAVRLGRRRPPSPPGAAGRLVLPSLRPGSQRRRLHPGAISHRPRAG